MTNLIVNADDYGLSEHVSRGILRAHRDGIVTSTTVLAVGRAFSQTGAWLGDVPSLGVGVHLAAVGEDPPLLSRREIPTLVDRSGKLATSWRSFLLRAGTGRVDPADVAREFRAQIEAARGLGRPITHLDSHQHLHLCPGVRDVVLALARELAIGAVRRVRSSHRRWAGIGVNLLSSSFTKRADAAGVAYPDGFAGFDEAGHLDEQQLLGILARLAARKHGSVEICTHPGEENDVDRKRYAWGYEWSRELAALTSPRVRRAVTELGYELTTFAALSRQ